MSKKNQLTALQRDVLAPLIGKIAIGFRYDPSPNRQLFSDKFTVRLRPIGELDSEVALGIHYKTYGPAEQLSLNLSVNLMLNSGSPSNDLLQGFSPEHQHTLQEFLRQPITGFHLTPDQVLVLIFSHQSLIFELDQNEARDLYLGWALS